MNTILALFVDLSAEAAPSWADALTAIGTFLLAGFAVVAALLTAGQIKEARSLRREQARPYVVVYAEINPISGHLVDIVIANLGATGATDVRVTCDQPLERSGRLGAEVHLPESLPFLAPGQHWRTFWDSAPDRKEAELVERYEISTIYTDSLGVEHTTASVLDWASVYGRTFIDEKTVHHAVKELEKIAKVLGTWPHLGEVVKVATYDGAKYDAEQTKTAAALEQASREFAELQQRQAPAGPVDSGSQEKVAAATAGKSGLRSTWHRLVPPWGKR